MLFRFCIVQVLGDVLDYGEIRFVEAAETLEDAKRRIETLATSLPGEYVIYDEETGARLSVNALGKGRTDATYATSRADLVTEPLSNLTRDGVKSRADGFEDFEQFGCFGYR